MNGIRPLIRRDRREISLSLQYEDTARKWSSANQEEGPQQQLTLVLEVPTSTKNNEK